MSEARESSFRRPRRLTLTIPSLAGGGAERVAALLANYWAAADLDVTLITLASAEHDVQTLDRRITRVGLDVVRESHNSVQALWSNAGRLRAQWKALRASRPEVIVSFLDQMNVLTLLATRGVGVPVVIAERTNPERHRIGRVWSRLRRWTYPWCRALVVQTEQVRRRMEPLVAGRPVVVIPNGVAEPAGCGDPRPESSERTIMAMGRLAPEKGFDLLIEAFASLAARHPMWRVVIFGEGPQRGALEGRIRARGLADRVLLPGWEADLTPRLRAADLFVLSSRYEGFPNALLEAMACGVAAVSFDCPYGPGEVVRDGEDGLLVPAEDTAALASALDRLMGNDAERCRLGAAAREVVERFGLPTFFARWDAIVLGSFGDPAAASLAK